MKNANEKHPCYPHLLEIREIFQLAGCDFWHFLEDWISCLFFPLTPLCFLPPIPTPPYVLAY